MKRTPLQRRTPLTARRGLSRGKGIQGHPTPDTRGRARFVDPGPPLDLSAVAAVLSARRTESPEYAGPVETSQATPKPRATGFPAVVRQTIIDRDHMACVRCGRAVDAGSFGYSLQHRDNRGMGGTRDERINLPANGIVLCGSGTTECHGWVEDHETEAARCGWVVLSWADPETVPVLTHTGAWVLLSNKGTAWPTSEPPEGDAHAVARRKGNR